jgi:hypothetical protein
MAPVSLVCFSPSRSTITLAASPVSSIFSSTCLAIEPEIVPLPISASSSPRFGADRAGGQILARLVELAEFRKQPVGGAWPTSGGRLALARTGGQQRFNQRAVSTSMVSWSA